MVNGLNGGPNNWSVLHKQLVETMGQRASKLLLFTSHANKRLSTFGGICRCAKRLSTELELLIRLHPSLREISFLVHSMGGLITRYACGLRYDPEQKTIFGLRPRHFFSIASPHLGCHIEGESQVPMLGWGFSLPVVGPLLLRPLVSLLTPFVMKHLYRRSGEQLFLLDAHHDGKDFGTAFMCRLVEDIPEEGYFFSALKSFQSRTCCANVQQDALVSWTNASIRRQQELPYDVDQLLSHCVVHRTDDLLHAMQKPEEREEDKGSEEVSVSSGNDRHMAVEFMLKRLQSLPWCRIDVCFHGLIVPCLAHNHIQVTRRWIDFVGVPVIRHIAETFASLDALVSNTVD